MPPLQKRGVLAQIPFPVPQLDTALNTPFCVNSPLSWSPRFSTFKKLGFPCPLLFYIHRIFSVASLWTWFHVPLDPILETHILSHIQTRSLLGLNHLDRALGLIPSLGSWCPWAPQSGGGVITLGIKTRSALFPVAPSWADWRRVVFSLFPIWAAGVGSVETLDNSCYQLL